MDRAMTLWRTRHTKELSSYGFSYILGAGILPGKNPESAYLRRRAAQEYNDTLTALTTGTRLAGRLEKEALPRSSAQVWNWYLRRARNR